MVWAAMPGASEEDRCRRVSVGGRSAASEWIHPRRRRLAALHGSRAQGWVPITEIHARKVEGMTMSECIGIGINSAYMLAHCVNAVSSACRHSKASDPNDHRDCCWDEEGRRDRRREGNGRCIVQGAKSR